MIPASDEFGVPGADDAAIFADMIELLGRDSSDVRDALAALSALSGARFADLPASEAEAVAAGFLARGDRLAATLGRVVLTMLLSRRTRGAGARTGAGAAISQGAHVGTRRLVAAGCRAWPRATLA